MDKTEVIKELDGVIMKTTIAAQKLMNLKARTPQMNADEIMQEMLLILSFGDELDKKPSIIV